MDSDMQRFADSAGNDEFKKFIESLIEKSRAQGPPTFPIWFVNDAGGQLEVHLTADPYYSQWIDSGLELHISYDEKKIVGLTIPLTKDGMGRIREVSWLFE